MFHDLDAVCVHELGPFSLETSGIMSSFLEHQCCFDCLSVFPIILSLELVEHEISCTDTLIVFIFLYSRPRLWFALF